ncbi:MAG: MmcQ/YjbR family DNA-binding protein [Pseudomonadota bacterium]
MLKRLHNYCLTFPGATENIQWGDDRVYKVAGKMFCCSGIENDAKFSFKVDDDRFLELTDREGILPAPYLARAKWIQVDPKTTVLKWRDIKPLLEQSYELVVAKLPKKTQAALDRP